MAYIISKKGVQITGVSSAQANLSSLFYGNTCFMDDVNDSNINC